MPKKPLIVLPAPAGRPDVLIIAGEHSGDQHAARLLQQASARAPLLHVCALGGPRLAEAGAGLLYDLTASSVVGLFEVLKHYGFFKALFEATVAWVREHKPRVLVLVDYPGFNLRLAQRLKAEGLSRAGGGQITIIYYIGPQIWAWKAKRRFKMASLLDGLAVIFPFEVGCYQDTTLPTAFVGHPFVAPGFTLPVRHDPAGPILLLPGSRKTPVARIFPKLLAGYQAYRKAGGDRPAFVLYPSQTVKGVLEATLARSPALAEGVQLLPAETGAAGSAVLMSSGTMSLACSLAGIPGAIVYRANPFTYAVGRMVVKIPYLGIANILLQRPAWPEFLQGAATPTALAAQLQECLSDPARAAKAADDARALRELLSPPAALSAADWLLARIPALMPPAPDADPTSPGLP